MATYVLVINGVGVVVSQDKIINAFVIVRVRWYLFEETSVRAVKSFSGDVKRQKNNMLNSDGRVDLRHVHVDFDNTSYCFVITRNTTFRESIACYRELRFRVLPDSKP